MFIHDIQKENLINSRKPCQLYISEAPTFKQNPDMIIINSVVKANASFVKALTMTDILFKAWYKASDSQISVLVRQSVSSSNTIMMESCSLAQRFIAVVLQGPTYWLTALITIRTSAWLEIFNCILLNYQNINNVCRQKSCKYSRHLVVFTS